MGTVRFSVQVGIIAVVLFALGAIAPRSLVAAPQFWGECGIYENLPIPPAATPLDCTTPSIVFPSGYDYWPEGEFSWAASSDFGSESMYAHINRMILGDANNHTRPAYVSNLKIKVFSGYYDPVTVGIQGVEYEATDSGVLISVNLTNNEPVIYYNCPYTNVCYYYLEYQLTFLPPPTSTPTPTTTPGTPTATVTGTPPTAIVTATPPPFETLSAPTPIPSIELPHLLHLPTPPATPNGTPGPLPTMAMPTVVFPTLTPATPGMPSLSMTLSYSAFLTLTTTFSSPTSTGESPISGTVGTGVLSDTGMLSDTVGIFTELMSYTLYISTELNSMLGATGTFNTDNAPDDYAPALPRPMANIGYRLEQMKTNPGARYSLNAWAGFVGEMVGMPFYLVNGTWTVAFWSGPFGLFLAWLIIMIPVTVVFRFLHWIKALIIWIIEFFMNIFSMIIEVIKFIADIFL